MYAPVHGSRHGETPRQRRLSALSLQRNRDLALEPALSERSRHLSGMGGIPPERTAQFRLEGRSASAVRILFPSPSDRTNAHSERVEKLEYDIHIGQGLFHETARFRHVSGEPLYLLNIRHQSSPPNLSSGRMRSTARPRMQSSLMAPNTRLSWELKRLSPMTKHSPSPTE